MFWKRKSEAAPISRAGAARAASLDQARPVPILKPAAPSSPIPSPSFAHGQGSEVLAGSAGSIRFAGDTGDSQCGSPSSGRSRSISPQRSPLPLQGAQMAGQAAGMPLYQPAQSPQRSQLPAISTHNIIHAPQARQSTQYNKSYGVSHPHPPSPTHPAMQRVQAQSSRRSSRPASPTTTSFGARLPYASGSSSSQGQRSHIAAPVRSHSLNGQPLSTPPLGSASRITTPPTAYCPAGQPRAAPPSPYRSSERVPMELVPGSSLFDTPCAPSRLVNGQTPKGVPMLNIIPATPQTMGEEWGLHGQTPRQGIVHQGEVRELQGAFGEVDVAAPTASASAPIITISEPQMKRQESLPELDELQFSPFEGRMVLPTSSSIDSLPSRSPPANLVPLQMIGTPDTIRVASPPAQPLPSPPFESYGSLPSLDSEQSMPSSASSSSLRSSSSSSSLNSYPDVEEALGSMLASLSDPSMPLPPINSFSKRTSEPEPAPGNAGLGLGLALNDLSINTTAPLSPRRKAPPAPLDLSLTNTKSYAPAQQSCPPRINHRVAFYSSAKAAPNSPHSGVFTQIPHSSSGSVEGHTEFVSSPNPGYGPTRTWSQTSLSTEDTELSYARGMRDSISLASEASDEDLQTASIVCLTPVRAEYDYTEERVRGYVAEVGVAL